MRTLEGAARNCRTPGGLFLGAAEVLHLTGCEDVREQKKRLREYGLAFIVGRDREPLVYRRHISIVTAIRYSEADRVADLPTDDGLVYIVDEGADDSPVKIGLTSKGWPKQIRLPSLQIGNPRKLRWVCLHPAAPQVEQYIHELLAPWSLRGEWFKRGPEVACFVRTAVTEGYRAAMREIESKTTPR